jgi:hypothetical protein
MSATNLFLYKEWISDTIKQNQDILKWISFKKL